LEAANALRSALICGAFPGMGTGDPDLYKAFCWRFRRLIKEYGGHLGVVLPRSAWSASGSTEFRRNIFKQVADLDLTTLVNNREWVFTEVHPQYSITLTAASAGQPDGKNIHLRGPFRSYEDFVQGRQREPATFKPDEVESWTETASLPLLPTADSPAVFAQLRKSPPLSFDDGQSWRARPHRELDATNDKHLLDVESADCPKGYWPVYKGTSFDLWQPDTGTYYGFADLDTVVPHLNQKRWRGRNRGNSVWFEFADQPLKWWQDAETLPCYSPRIAFRDVTRATDSRTIRAALLPPHVFATNKAPFLLWPRGDEMDQSYLLGVLCSIPLDWYIRRFIETTLNFFVFNPLPVPRPGRDHPLRQRVVELAGRLAAPDDRFADWAQAVGVDHGPLADDEKQAMICELDAVACHLYGLNQKQLTHIFETFHEGWDYTDRLKQTLEHYRSWRNNS